MSRSHIQSDVARQAYAYFLEKGLPPHRAAALAGNMAWESGGRHNDVTAWDNRKVGHAPHSIGIGQWNDRSPALVSFARQQGINLPQGDLRDVNYARTVASTVPLKTQLDFAWNEMQGSEKRAFTMVQGAGDLRTATAGGISYHRPAGWSWRNPYGGHGFNQRLAIADGIMRNYGTESAAMRHPGLTHPGEEGDTGTISTTAAVAAPSLVPQASPRQRPSAFQTAASASPSEMPDLQSAFRVQKPKRTAAMAPPQQDLSWMRGVSPEMAKAMGA